MRRITCTTTEAQLRAWLADGETAPQIAARLGVHANYVYVTLAMLGIVPAPKRVAAEVFLAEIAQGKPLEEAAAAHGYTRTAAMRVLKRAGLPTCAADYLRRMAQQHTEFSSPSAEGSPAGRLQAVGGTSVASG